ncbi:MAG: nucleoid-associated protein [Bacteroidota bacterium]
MEIHSLIVHWVGNKVKEEEVILSNNLLPENTQVFDALSIYFSTAFEKSSDLFRLSHLEEIAANSVYQSATKVFNDPSALLEESEKLAQILYDCSNHPNVKSGEFFVVYFEDCLIEGEVTDALGLFKSESKDEFLKTIRHQGNFLLENEKGININKLDKGCIIYNLEQSEGYVVGVVDQTNGSNEARYWMDEFLQVKERKDEFHQTKNALDVAQHFIKEGLNREFEVSKAEEAELLANSMKFFKTNDNFSMEDFGNEVIGQPEVIEEFNNYRQNFADERGVVFEDEFDISPRAVKKSTKNFRSVIKLDKNFHIYVHGNPNLISQDEDENGKFYKIYYRDEN